MQSQDISVSEGSCSQGLSHQPDILYMLLHMPAFLARTPARRGLFTEAFSKACLRCFCQDFLIGEVRGNFEDTLLYYGLVLSTFAFLAVVPLSSLGLRIIKLQKPFVRGSLDNETTPSSVLVHLTFTSVLCCSL